MRDTKIKQRLKPQAGFLIFLLDFLFIVLGLLLLIISLLQNKKILALIINALKIR